MTAGRARTAATLILLLAGILGVWLFYLGATNLSYAQGWQAECQSLSNWASQQFQTQLSSVRKQARTLLAATEEVRLREEKKLLDSLQSEGVPVPLFPDCSLGTGYSPLPGLVLTVLSLLGLGYLAGARVDFYPFSDPRSAPPASS